MAIDPLIQNSLLQQNQPAPGDEKPAVLFTIPGLIGGMNFGQAANGTKNFDAPGLFGKSLTASSVEEGGQPIMSWASKVKKGSFTQEEAKKVGAAYIQSFLNGSQASAGGGGGSSGGSSGGGSSGDSTTTASSGSSAPVSSGGGGGGGGSSSSAPQERGGSGDAGLSRAIASLQGMTFDPQVISAPTIHGPEISAPTIAAPTPQAPIMAMADDGMGGRA